MVERDLSVVVLDPLPLSPLVAGGFTGVTAGGVAGGMVGGEVEGSRN